MKRVIVFVLVAALVNTACAYAAKDKVERSFKLEYFDELDVTSAIKVSRPRGRKIVSLSEPRKMLSIMLHSGLTGITNLKSLSIRLSLTR